MRQIPLGAKGFFTLLVQPEHLANRFKDAMLPPVLATPVMIMVMENAALNAIKAYLDPGESAVGTAVDIRHLAPTPVGRQVVGVAEVTKVDGRRIEFSVRATEGTRDRRRIAFESDHRCGQIRATALWSRAAPSTLTRLILPSAWGRGWEGGGTRL